MVAPVCKLYTGVGRMVACPLSEAEGFSHGSHSLPGLPSQLPGFERLLLRVMAVEKPLWAVPHWAVHHRAMDRRAVLHWVMPHFDVQHRVKAEALYSVLLSVHSTCGNLNSA